MHRGVAGALVLVALLGAAASAAASPRERLTLRVGTQPISTLDPHLAASVADIQILEQIYEHLTKVDARGRPSGELAAEWESEEGRSWTFTLREGARFSSGRPVTARDVLFSFRRLRDPSGGTAAAGLLQAIRDVEALDERRVRFVLDRADPEFPAALADYHAVILPAGTRDPPAEGAGSGPFALAYYVPGERVILRRNPHYALRDPQGVPLPHLEELRFELSSDLAGQVRALQEGRLDFVGGLTTELARTLRRSHRTRVLTVEANMHWVIHMRSDPGHPAADNRVRRALKLATRHQGLVDALRPGLASVGNGFSPVGPAFGMLHLVRPPFPDTARAQELRAQAGFPEGLEIRLEVPEHPEALALAAAWKQQVARIGVGVSVGVHPVRQYYGSEGTHWLNAEFAITDWGARSSPLQYFKLAYAASAPWNQSHWSDPEFDALVERLSGEMDERQRILLYHEAQEILIDRGPVIVPYFLKAVAGADARLKGVSLAADWPRTQFRDAHFE